MKINFDRVREALEELRSRDQQLILWTGRGDGKKMSSFVEASCSLFDDSGLGDVLLEEPSALDAELRALFVELNQAFHQVDENEEPDVMIASDVMERVRRLATQALKACNAL